MLFTVARFKYARYAMTGQISVFMVQPEMMKISTVVQCNIMFGVVSFSV